MVLLNTKNLIHLLSLKNAHFKLTIFLNKTQLKLLDCTESCIDAFTLFFLGVHYLFLMVSALSFICVDKQRPKDGTTFEKKNIILEPVYFIYIWSVEGSMCY